MGEFKTIKDMIQGACSPAEGLTLAGNKFLVIKVVAGDCVLCKKGQAGLTIAKSMQCKFIIVSSAIIVMTEAFSKMY